MATVGGSKLLPVASSHLRWIDHHRSMQSSLCPLWLNCIRLSHPFFQI